MKLKQAIASADSSLLEPPYMVAALHTAAVGYCVWIVCCPLTRNISVWYYLSVAINPGDSIDTIRDRILDHWDEAKPISRLFDLQADGGPKLDWDLYTLTQLKQDTDKKVPRMVRYHL